MGLTKCTETVEDAEQLQPNKETVQPRYNTGKNDENTQLREVTIMEPKMNRISAGFPKQR